MNINEKELIKQIKASKNSLVWSVQDEVHYISNRHWAVRYKNLPTIVLTTMFSIFAEIPGNNSSFSTAFGEIQKDRPLVDVQTNMTLGESVKPGKITDVLVENGSLMRVVECCGDLIYISNDYIQMVQNFDDQPLCSGLYLPVFFCDGNLIILPYRVKEVTHKKIIQELIAI